MDDSKKELLKSAYIKEGKESLELTQEDLFDKIINLKFIRQSGKYFTIRSDYEPVFHEDNKVTFRRCVEKPDIKITYKQVAQEVAIEVDITITNLTVSTLDGESSRSMETSSGDPVRWCVVQMGYRKDFKDYYTEGAEIQSVSHFYGMVNKANQSGKQMLVQILTGYPQSYPPDKTIYFQGIIGTIEKGLSWKRTEKDAERGSDPEVKAKGFTELEEVLYQFVTRRFFRNHADTVHLIEVETDPNGGPPKHVVKINKIDANGVGKWEKLELAANGIMTVQQAKDYGVQCTISDYLKELPTRTVPGRHEAIYPKPTTTFNNATEGLGGQMVLIQNHYPFIRWSQDTDGNLHITHVDESDKDLQNDSYIRRLADSKEPLRLPAIYDMTPAGTRTIRCPFYKLINPMSKVLFESRFTLGTLVSFFYPPKTNAFLVITQKVEFATVQDANQMELMCVDMPRVNIDGRGEPVKEDKTAKKEDTQPKGDLSWIEDEVTVELYKNGAYKNSTWQGLVWEVRSSVNRDSWPADKVYEETTEKKALEALLSWNEKYRNMSTDPKNPENIVGIGKKTGKPVPWLRPGDKVTIRRPFQKEYPPDQKRNKTEA